MEKGRTLRENQYRCVDLDMLREMIRDKEKMIKWNRLRLPNYQIRKKIKEQKRDLEKMEDGLRHNIHNEK